jgi:signal transduction histidine kinase
LVEVFQNLIDNAVKFSRSVTAPRIELLAQQIEGEIVLRVRDNGIGIDSRHQHKLFGLFEKLHPEMEGTGIGLALVKRIIDVHGGRIWVDSAGPGQGTTVSFTLPGTKREES